MFDFRQPAVYEHNHSRIIIRENVEEGRFDTIPDFHRSSHAFRARARTNRQ